MKRLFLTLFIFSVIFLPALASSAVLYVSPSGTWGAGQTAFTTVQQAVDTAVEGDEIWVAQGTYYENIVIFKGPASGAGIKLFGGFSGTETERIQRDLKSYQTILDGGNVRSVVMVEGSRATIDGFTIQNGAGTEFWPRGIKGGGILVRPNSATTITNNRIVRNTARHGAGISIEENTVVTVVSNIIADNQASPDGGAGGGLLIVSGRGTIANNTLVRNQAGIGGGLANWCAETLVENNIIAFNPSGNGIYLHHNCETVPLPTMDYNIVYGNLPDQYYTYSSGVPILDFPRPNDMQHDPLFINFTAGDFHLQPISPAIDAGAALYSDKTFTDLDGNPRIIGTAVDIGAFEHSDQTPPVTTAIPNGTSGLGSWYISDVTVNLSSSDESGVCEIRYSVDGGAEIVATGSTATVEFTAEGIHTLTYYAADANGNIEAAKSMQVAIDKNTPTVIAKLSGTAGTNGWYRSAVNATLLATDTASGVKEIRYSLNGGALVTVNGASASVSLPVNQISTLSYSAVDTAGNSSQAITQTASSDSEAPTLAVATSPISIKSNGKLQSVKITGSASDALSGIASTSFKVSDKSDNVVATAISFGSYVQLKGTKGQVYTVTATSVDKAGNSATAKTSVYVK
jgi:hypothetical protein